MHIQQWLNHLVWNIMNKGLKGQRTWMDTDKTKKG